MFQDHFQAREEPRDETTQETLTDDGEITGSAANLLPEPEPARTPEPRRPETEASNEPVRRDDEPTGINTPTGVQGELETRDEEEVAEEINTKLLFLSIFT